MGRCCDVVVGLAYACDPDSSYAGGNVASRSGVGRGVVVPSRKKSELLRNC